MDTPQSGETFAQLIQRIMDTYQVNQSEIARRIGVSVSTVNYWVSGQRQAPRVATLRKLADAFPAITVDEFFNAVGRPAPAPLSSDREERLLEYFRKLTTEQQDSVEALAKFHEERNRSSS